MQVVVIRIYDFTNRTKTCKVVTAKFISESNTERDTLKSVNMLVTNEFTPSGVKSASYFLVVAHPRRIIELLSKLKERKVNLDCRYNNNVYVGYARKLKFITEDGEYIHSLKKITGLSDEGETAVLSIIDELKYFD